jgi:glycosyltransferase involved in cell wall biosynthesis
VKRILFLSMVFPRAYDRTRGTFCYATCKALARRHELHVVSPVSWLERLKCGQAADELFARDVGPTDFPLFVYPPRIWQHTHRWWMWQSIGRSLTKAARTFQPDAVLSYWVDPDGTVAVRLGQKLKIPVGIIVGGSDVLLLPRQPRRRRVICQTLQAADAVFTVSRDLQEKTVALGVAAKRVHVVYQGVDESFCPGDATVARQAVGLPADRPVALWVGKMVPVKGLDVLLNAFAVVAAANPAALLVLVGHGPDRGAVEQQVKTLRLTDRVRLAGAVHSEQLPDWYRAADVTVLSSHSEGIPNVLRESLACGTPYVATRVGGIAELSSDPANRLVPPGDPAALAQAMLQALAARERIAADAVQRGWQEYADRLVEVLCGCGE